MILRFLNIQGIAGIAAGLALGILLVTQKVETRHWRKKSGQFEQLYTQEQAALAGTIANYRAAAEAARAADKAAAERLAAEQHAISERTSHDFEARLADARARATAIAGQLRIRFQAAADPRGRGAAPMPGLSAPSGQLAGAAGEDRLPPADALTATEQAIQLDELIKWVKAEGAVDPNEVRK